VTERPERLFAGVAQQRERTILDEPHAVAAGEIDELPNRLRPTEVVNNVQHVRTMHRAEALDLGRIGLSVAADRVIADRGARRVEREHFVAAVVIGHENRQLLVGRLEYFEEVINRIPRAIEREVRYVERVPARRGFTGRGQHEVGGGQALEGWDEHVRRNAGTT
jgi:hypothetical protein